MKFDEHYPKVQILGRLLKCALYWVLFRGLKPSHETADDGGVRMLIGLDWPANQKMTWTEETVQNKNFSALQSWAGRST